MIPTAVTVKFVCSQCGKLVYVNQQGCVRIELHRCIRCGGEMCRAPLNAIEKLIPARVLGKMFN